MSGKRTLWWSARFVGFASLAAVVGMALVGAGAAVGATEIYTEYQSAGMVTWDTLTGALPGLVLVLIGGVVYWLGRTWAMYQTLGGLIEERLASTYDNERVKSEILAVLDERLSEMQGTLDSVKRRLPEEGAAEFEFGDD